MPKVIVIGGGVAGMSAAHELVERGFQVEIFERNPRYVGGKARSVDAPGTNKIDPKHLQSLYNAGIVYAVDLKQPEKATSYWNRYLKLDSNSPTANQIKSLMEQPGKLAAPSMK